MQFRFEIPILLKGLPDNFTFYIKPNLKTNLFFIRGFHEKKVVEIPVFKGVNPGNGYMSLFNTAKYMNGHLKILNLNETIEFDINLTSGKVTINYESEISELFIKKFSAGNPIGNKK